MGVLLTCNQPWTWLSAQQRRIGAQGLFCVGDAGFFSSHFLVRAVLY